MSIYITIHTKEKGKQELTRHQWNSGKGAFLTYHRENGPAIEWIDGDKEWLINGKLHREDGPASEFSNGDVYWFINSEEYSEADYNKLLKKVDLLEPILGLTDPRDWVRKRFERKYKKVI